MAYRANPFLERMSERTTSDQEFVRLFSPKILERLSDDAFEGAVHIFRSPPGGGKTTLLRAFTPTALRAFWNARRVQEMSETYRGLVAREVLHEQDGPLVLGVFLSCASGYADLPPGATITKEGLFRALLNCRIVLRTLRSLASLLGYSSSEQLDDVRLEYDDTGRDLKSIPVGSSCKELAAWAEQHERGVYVELDSLVGDSHPDMPTDVRFEGVLWLQSVRFIVDGRVVAPKRLLMIDDLHKLRRRQRALLIEEFIELRPSTPVWLAERSIALGEELLSQGAREGRELREYSLEDIWSGGQHQFATFAQNILDRRLDVQNLIPPGPFAQYLRDGIRSDDVRIEIEKGIDAFRHEAGRYRSNPRYSEWLERAEGLIAQAGVDAVRELYVTRTLIARDQAKRQLSLELGPLSAEELQQRDSSQLQAAAEILINNELKIPYYYGIERLCVMATSNVEELLSLAAALYDGLLAKKVLRKPDLLLSPHEQEKLLKEVARRKRDFIPKNHTEGGRAQRLLDSIGSYCRERTFLPNAPYAPGVTGVRLSLSELRKLRSNETSLIRNRLTLSRVLAECVAENLLFTRESSESTSRERGTIFYLNRTLCLHYGLPLQMGGWQDLATEQLVDWMEEGRGRVPSTRKLLKIGE
jgi:hypothetical protein